MRTHAIARGGRRAATAALLAVACTWIPPEDVTTGGEASTPPTGTQPDADTGATPTEPTRPTEEALDVFAFAPARAGRLNRVEVGGVPAGAAATLAMWSSASPSSTPVAGCPGLTVSPADLGCLSAPAAPVATPTGTVSVELCVPGALAGLTVEYRVVQPDGCLQSAVHTVTFPARRERALTDAAAVLSPEALEDFAGEAVAVGDLDADGVADVVVGAPFYSDGGAQPLRGRAYVLYGPVASANLANADVILAGQSNEDHAGDGVAFVGDVDGQPGDELVIGAPTYNGNGSRRGRVYLVSAPPPGTTGLGALPAFTGPGNDDMTGWGVAGAGDVNGDGLADVLIGAPEIPPDYGEGGAGRVYLFLGDPVVGQVLTTPAATLVGRAQGDTAGHAVAGPGDTDGDGLADLLIGAPFDDTRGTAAGAAFLVHGDRALGEGSLADADGIFLGEDAFNLAGWSVGAAGDTDGDGLGDLLVGADWNGAAGTGAGAAYLLLGRAAPGEVALSDAEAKLVGAVTEDRAGGSVSTAGDLDGDGYADLLVGATGVDTAVSNAGAAYVVYGPVWGAMSLAEADVRIGGTVERAFAGLAVAGGGDADGDGTGDVLLGTAGLGAYLVSGATLSGP